MRAAHIVFGSRTGHRFSQTDWLALPAAVVARLFLPLGIAESGARLFGPTALVLGSALAVLSPPVALRRRPASTITISLEPAIAATPGFLVLNQALSAIEFMAIAQVIAVSTGLCGHGWDGGGRRFRRPDGLRWALPGKRVGVLDAFWGRCHTPPHVRSDARHRRPS